ncbi:hypothetical protein [Serratia nematodiphila]|uniref:hypothetical protein n=1 Tax=Serratia nematodiphila TaxID=458197 RepID=UPI0011DA5F28|nr:hypothetical protein [Serratia nematodiphila]TXE58056.1 hypothetical protein FOT58_19175 [Serratia nematodiphila]
MKFIPTDKEAKMFFNKLKSIITIFILLFSSSIYAVNDKPSSESLLSWTSESNLCNHWHKHKNEDPSWAEDINNYAASVLAPRDFVRGVESFTGSDGRYYRYFVEDNVFAVFNSDNAAITSFKPSNGKKYWEKKKKENGIKNIETVESTSPRAEPSCSTSRGSVYLIERSEL